MPLHYWTSNSRLWVHFSLFSVSNFIAIVQRASLARSITSQPAEPPVTLKRKVGYIKSSDDKMCEDEGSNTVCFTHYFETTSVDLQIVQQMKRLKVTGVIQTNPAQAG
jgi:hypothetical protein